ncbi:TPA: methionine-binding protein [Klebsiella pneumoniae]|nr:methionine-binding protein [Klebsiella pneumoniae]HEL9927954.1 methionine-binding protein [Klebsiella pneumoniae]
MNKSVARGIALALLSATSFYAAADAHLIRVGFNPGPYKEQFEKGVAPYLLSKGYKIEYKDFSDGIQVNDAVARGDIEANIMQHPVYLKAINERLGIDNVGIVQVPTPPMGLYGGKLTTLGTPAAGTVVSVPNQPSNEYRAVLVLESLGWVKIKPDSDPATFSQRNIVDNSYKIVLKEMDNAQQVRALPDVDYGLIQGNFAVSSGMSLTSALKLEAATSHFINVVTVAGKNQKAQFAKDIIDGYHSAEFKKYILSHPQYDGYLLPDYLK